MKQLEAVQEYHSQLQLIHESCLTLADRQLGIYAQVVGKTPIDTALNITAYFGLDVLTHLRREEDSRKSRYLSVDVEYL
jgi:hypothetical protein